MSKYDLRVCILGETYFEYKNLSCVLDHDLQVKIEFK